MMPSGRPDPSPRRVALIGAGLAAAPWLDALADLGCQVVTVATRDEARFARVAERFPDALQVWPPSAALASTPIDVCIDLSPATAHLDGVRRAAEAGVPLIIEKPLATSLADGLTAVEVAAGAGIPLAVCLQYRYQEGARALHDLVERGHLGPIRAATLEVPWWRDADYYAEPGRGTYRRDGGGVLLTQAVHALDLLGWYLGGLPDWVSAHLGHGAIHDIEVEDVAAAVMGYGGGSCAATVFATTGARSAEPVVLRLVGERATARLVGTTLEVHDGGQAPVPDAASADAVSARDPMAFPSRWHRAFLEDTLAAFDAGRPPPIGGPEAVVSLAVIDALERSSAAAARVRPAVTGHPPRRWTRPWTPGWSASRRPSPRRCRSPTCTCSPGSPVTSAPTTWTRSSCARPGTGDGSPTAPCCWGSHPPPPPSSSDARGRLA